MPEPPNNFNEKVFLCQYERSMSAALLKLADAENNRKKALNSHICSVVWSLCW